MEEKELATIIVVEDVYAVENRSRERVYHEIQANFFDVDKKGRLKLYVLNDEQKPVMVCAFAPGSWDRVYEVGFCEEVFAKANDEENVDGVQ